MNILSIIMLGFAVIGAADRIIGNRFGLGKEFEKGFLLLGTMALSMVGMIVISPLLADLLSPFFDLIYKIFCIDPSVVPAVLFANDMGGAPLAREIAKNESIGMFNALVTSSMMGATVSYTLPLSLTIVKKEHHRELLLGILCGIVTIPVGCFVGGLMLKIPILTLLLNLLPLIIFSIIVGIGILFAPNITVKFFSFIAVTLKALITVGLILGILEALTGKTLIKGLGDVFEASNICFNASMVLAGAFPFMHIVSRLLKRPIAALAKKLEVEYISAFGLISNLVTNTTTIEMMNDMDKKGIVLNGSFIVSAAFLFGGHLAFTIAFDADYVAAMIVSKLIAGISALFVATIVYKKTVK